MKLSINIGNREFSIGVGKSVADFIKGTDIDDAGRGAALNTPYEQSAWVYCAISIIAQSIAQIPFRISRVGGDQARKVRALRGSADPVHRQLCRRALGETILESGGAVDLFNRPHPTMDRELFWEMAVTWNCLRGEFFILPLDAADGAVDLKQSKARVQRMLTLSPDRFWHLVQGYELTAWRYTGSPLMAPLASEMLFPGEVIHSRSPNPYIYWRGLSPLSVALTPAQTDFAGEQFQKGLWLNNADTGVIVTTDQQATPEQQAAIIAALRERKRKAGTPDRPLFLFGGAKVDKPTLSMMDMQFLETRKFLRQEIFAIFKVPEMLAGFTQDLNDGGAGGSLDAQKSSFIESTIGALAKRLETAVAPIVQTFGPDLVGWFDIDSLPIMQAARRSRIDVATKAFALGYTRNEINQMLDLGYPEDETGDKRYLPFNLQEIGAESELPGENEQTEPAPDDEGKDIIGGARKFLSTLNSPTINQRKPAIDVVQLWKKHIASRRAAVAMFQSKTNKVLLKFRQKALNKLNEVHLEKSAGRLGEIKGLVDIIFSHLAFSDALGHELTPPMKSTLQSAADELLAEVSHDDPWEYPPKAVTEYITGRTQRIKGVGGVVRDQLNTSLEEGIVNGETHQQLADRVKVVFNNLTAGEAKRVAMTEVNVAYNTARHEAMDSAGIEYKAWLSSHGPHVRPAHAEAEEVYLNEPIPLDQPFEVGGDQLMFPGDDSLGADLGNIINCQCVQLAAQKAGDDEKTVTYKIFGAGVMSFPKHQSQGGQA